MFLIPVRTVRAAARAGAERDGIVARDVSRCGLGVRLVSRGATTGAGAVGGDVAGGTLVGAGAAGGTGAATAESVLVATATAESDGATTDAESALGDCSARRPKYRRNVSGIVNSNPYRLPSVPRDTPCSVETSVFVTCRENVCGVSGIA